MELLLLLASHCAINVNVMLINYSKWGRGTSEGVTRVRHWPPFLMVIN